MSPHDPHDRRKYHLHHPRRYDRRHFAAPGTEDTAQTHLSSGGIPSKPLTTDQLNNLSQGHSFDSSTQGLAYLKAHASVSDAPPSSSISTSAPTAPDGDHVIGRVDYRFKLDGVPHSYSGEMRSDGTFKGQVYQITDKGNVPASLPEVEMKVLEKYAREDITNIRKDNPDTVVGIGGELSQARKAKVSQAITSATIAEMVGAQKGMEGAEYVNDMLHHHPATALEFLYNNVDSAKKMIRENPFLPKIIEDYCVKNPGTDLSNKLGEIMNGVRLQTAARSNAPSF